LRQQKTIGKGWNKLEIHGGLKKKYGYFSIHAECDCILNAAKSQGDTLIVVRILKNGELSCSKPCEKCIKFAKDYGIKKIYYIDWNKKIRKMKT